ncbi:MAG TPA: hypothetical protein VF177_22985, partial [Anaerolineae bacterium]
MKGYDGRQSGKLPGARCNLALQIHIVAVLAFFLVTGCRPQGPAVGSPGPTATNAFSANTSQVQT